MVHNDDQVRYAQMYKEFEAQCLNAPVVELYSYLTNFNYQLFDAHVITRHEYKIPFGQICINKDWERIEVFIQARTAFPDEAFLWSEGLYQTVSKEMVEFLPFFYNHPTLNLKEKINEDKRYRSFHSGLARGLSYSRETLRFMYDWLCENQLTQLLEETQFCVLQENGNHKSRLVQPLYPQRAYFLEAGVQMALEELHITGQEPALRGVATRLARHPTHAEQFLATLKINRDKKLLEQQIPLSSNSLTAHSKSQRI